MPHDWPSEGIEPLVFRYEYDFMSTGHDVAYRVDSLILVGHRRREKQCYRKGAYFAHASASAKLVLYDGIDQKYLDIRIIGEKSHKRSELLSVIREHVRGINSRFQEIEIIWYANGKRYSRRSRKRTIGNPIP